MPAKLAILIVSAALLAGGGCSGQSMQIRTDGYYNTMFPKGGGTLFLNPFSWGSSSSSGSGTVPGAGINASYNAPISAHVDAPSADPALRSDIMAGMSDMRPRGLRLRFSLRTLLLATLAIGSTLGWVLHERRRIAARRTAIEAAGFHDLGYTVPFPQPEWHKRLFGNDWPNHLPDLSAPYDVTDSQVTALAGLNQLRSLSISGSANVTDTACLTIGTLDGLESLDLRDTAISDVGLERLVALPRLTSLDLGHTRISDAGLAQLARMPQLESLSVAGCRCTPSGLARLIVLPRLEKLDLSDTPFGNAEALGLGNLTRLKQLNLSRTQITDEGLLQIKRLPALEGLRIDATSISDAGIAHLASVRTLTFLSVRSLAIHDAALASVAELSTLEYLQAQDTLITDEGVSEILKLESLRSVNVRNTAISPAGSARLIRAFRNGNVDF